MEEGGSLRDTDREKFCLPVDNEGAWCQVRHVRVHLLVHEPEGNALVAHQGLVVALHVCDAVRDG